VARSPLTESRMLRPVCMRSSLCAAVPGRPNMRSKRLRGLISIGSGSVSDFHDSVFMYAHAYAGSHPPIVSRKNLRSPFRRFEHGVATDSCPQ